MAVKKANLSCGAQRSICSISLRTNQCRFFAALKIPLTLSPLPLFPLPKGEGRGVRRAFSWFQGTGHGGPVDLAENHDNYLYGSPKK